MAVEPTAAPSSPSRGDAPNDPAWALIGLGANLGDAPATLRAAVRAIERLPGVAGTLRVSSLYRTAPIEATGPDFTNAAVCFRTALEPEALLVALQAIEAAAGRERPYRNAPRTLDLDVLLHGSRVLHTPTLTLPHPRAHQRRFVLAPVHELMPTLVWPGHARVADLLAGVMDQALERVAGPEWIDAGA